MSQVPPIAADIRERIIAAANELYEQSKQTGRDAFPTVNAVRHAARVDMNSASAVMREWKRQQLAPPPPVAVAVPESIQRALTAAGAAVWLEAQELANDALRNAQSLWEVERQGMDEMRSELADAFESQARDLSAVRGECDAALSEVAKRDAVIAELRQRVSATEVRHAEIERHAGELRDERNNAQQEAATARENAARLSGQVEALQSQIAALMATLEPKPQGK